MAQKPVTSAFTPPGPDRANIKSIEKNFNELYDSIKWKELLNTTFNVSITGTTFTLVQSWQQIKDTYSEVYFCVISLDDKSHTIILPTDMINKLNATAVFNLAPSVGANMFVTLGGSTTKIGTIRSSVNGSKRLIILAR
jgi:hypothetical protein